ncbi:MAG: hypothetical protein E4H15_03305 [Syntrophobacterales bacterium]|nr:MAG: hypothetical protein E4H15_03305 [Syntrophobacterales bacterium]
MKRLIVFCEIFILAILLVKVAAVGGVVRDTAAAGSDITEVKSTASSPVRTGEDAPVKYIPEDKLERERKLFTSLKEKEKELVAREDLLHTEEKRLQAEEKRLQELKEEVLAKIKALSGVRENLTTLLAAVEEFDDRKYKDLAKVYESTPAAQAGAMLNKMDTKTAAAIIMNMRSKKAGVVWGHIDPKKAVEITKEITQIGLAQKDTDSGAR